MTVQPEAPPPPDDWVYLDTSVLIHIEHALDGEWTPPPTPTPTKTDKLLIAAARIRFYGYRTRNNWWLVTSGEARKELIGKGNADWSIGFIFDLDQAADALTEEQIATEAARIELSGIKSKDARHLARAFLNPAINYFVSSDEDLVKKAKAVPPREGLRVLTVLEAEKALDIKPGERPPVTPTDGSPLIGQSWWIP